MPHAHTLAICLTLGLAALASTRLEPRSQSVPQKGATVTLHATGTFDVKLTPQPTDEKSADSKAEDSTLSRLIIDKQFHGDLDATSKGQMLGAMTAVKGSAGYVAIERVTGTLHGRTGTFILQHSGTMAHGTLQLSVTVVPDSATGQLTGLTGSMNIIITDGKHSYDFAYTLPDSH